MGVNMINHLIIVRLNNVHKEEQKTLKKYLESNCWDWTEINEETITKYGRTIKRQETIKEE